MDSKFDVWELSGVALKLCDVNFCALARDGALPSAALTLLVLGGEGTATGDGLFLLETLLVLQEGAFGEFGLLGDLACLSYVNVWIDVLLLVGRGLQIGWKGVVKVGGEDLFALDGESGGCILGTVLREAEGVLLLRGRLMRGMGGERMRGVER